MGFIVGRCPVSSYSASADFDFILLVALAHSKSYKKTSFLKLFYRIYVHLVLVYVRWTFLLLFVEKLNVVHISYSFGNVVD